MNTTKVVKLSFENLQKLTVELEKRVSVLKTVGCANDLMDVIKNDDLYEAVVSISKIETELLYIIYNIRGVIEIEAMRKAENI